MTLELQNSIIYLDIYRNTISEVIILGMSETLKAISDPVRREILELLKDGRKTAGEIERELLAQTDTNDDILHEKRKERTGRLSSGCL